MGSMSRSGGCLRQERRLQMGSFWNTGTFSVNRALRCAVVWCEIHRSLIPSPDG